MTLARGVRVLTRRDPDLARLVRAYGPPPLWARRPGFATLVHIILEQQVSLASARAAMRRLRAAGPVTPAHLLTYTDAELKAIGFSRQKTGYARLLALAIVEKRFDPAGLRHLDDEAVKTEMVKLKGIGAWSADIYLLMVLRRPDAWPSGDLALAVAAQKAKRLPARPSPEKLETLSQAWHPWRAVAARILWQAYLSERGRS